MILLKLLVSYPLAIFENRLGMTLTKHKISFKKWYPCRDSNPGTRFRKPLLYPLSYRGPAGLLWAGPLPDYSTRRSCQSRWLLLYFLAAARVRQARQKRGAARE